MSRVYDNWERLVGATLKREELRQIALCPSFSSCSSISSDFSLDPSDLINTDARAAALVGTVVGSLNSTLLQEIGVVRGLRDELQRLESNFSLIQLVLQDAEVKQRNNLVVQNWLRKLKDAAYDAEDVLDQIATEGLKQRYNSERGKHGQRTSFFSKSNPLLFRRNIANQVKDIRGRVDAMADESHLFSLSREMERNICL